MADTAPEVDTTSAAELLGVGRRHLAVRDFSAAVESLATACELLAKEHGDTADQCAEAYLWYGKALLGLSREESGVLGDGVPGTGDGDNEDEENDDENEENGENENGVEDMETSEAEKANGDDGKQIEETGKGSEDKVEKGEAESTTKDDEAASSKPADEEPGTSNGDANGDPNDESTVNLDEDDVDNLQLAWEMLELSRGILLRRASTESARALLADAHLALGEVALESETYDKAALEMQSCLEIQKELYCNDDRRIAETHYQIGLANSLASNFEDAITHFKNAANILESRIKTLENPSAATEDATVKKYSTADPYYSVEGEVKELKALLPEIREKIQDMMDYKAERSPTSEYLFLPWMGATIRGLFLRQAPTAGALIYTMAVVNGTINPLFLTAFTFLFLLEVRLWLEVARIVHARWERRNHAVDIDPDYEVETLWSSDGVQSVEVRNFLYAT